MTCKNIEDIKDSLSGLCRENDIIKLPFEKIESTSIITLNINNIDDINSLIKSVKPKFILFEEKFFDHLDHLEYLEDEMSDSELDNTLKNILETEEYNNFKDLHTFIKDIDKLLIVIDLHIPFDGFLFNVNISSENLEKVIDFIDFVDEAKSNKGKIDKDKWSNFYEEKLLELSKLPLFQRAKNKGQREIAAKEFLKSNYSIFKDKFIFRDFVEKANDIYKIEKDKHLLSHYSDPSKIGK